MAKALPQTKNVKSKLRTNIKKKKSLKDTLKSKSNLKKIFFNQLKVQQKAKTINDESLAEQPRNYVRIPKLPCDKKQICQGVNTLFQLIKKTETKNVLFDEDHPIFLQVTCVKIPQTPIRLIRFNLNYSLLLDTAEICLIVADKGKKKDPEGTIEYYEEILNKHSITNIKTILPYNQFKTEYGTQFELKRKLLGLYDYFLVDSRVCGFVKHLLGSIFYESRKQPSVVKMDTLNLKEHFELAIKKTILKMHSKGDCYSVQVGNTLMPEKHIWENISGILQDFRMQFPGGFENIRALGIKTSKSLTIPIYLTLKNNSEISIPMCTAPLPKHHKTVKGELSTQMDASVIVSPEGNVKVIKSKNKKKESVQELEETLRTDDGADDGMDTETTKNKDPSQNLYNDNDDLEKAEEDYLVNYEHEQEEAKTDDDSKQKTTRRGKKTKK